MKTRAPICKSRYMPLSFHSQTLLANSGTEASKSYQEELAMNHLKDDQGIWWYDAIGERYTRQGSPCETHH